MWIIFTDLVSAEIAQHCLLSLAPTLQQICEYWPGSEFRGHKVRLPAGKYVKPGFAAWCTLTDVQGSTLSTDGLASASVLLAYQTPGELIPETAEKHHEGESGAEFASKTDRQKTQIQARDRVGIGQVDTRWQQQYNSRTLWFQFTPRQLATLYNERHPLSELLPLEQNGMAFSPSVPERTPSTAITQDGQAWVDFSAQSLQLHGKYDGGDALELLARRNGESKAAKPATLREAARTLVREARVTLEHAARAGEQLPTWVAEIMTEACWQRYRSLCAEAARTGTCTASRGVTGFVPAEMSSHEVQESIAERGVQPTAVTHSVSHEGSQKQDSLKVLAVDICAQIGEPCSRCGCTLFYQSGSYRMCHQCYPCPAKFGRLTDEEWQRLRTLFPRKPAPMALSDVEWRKR